MRLNLFISLVAVAVISAQESLCDHNPTQTNNAFYVEERKKSLPNLSEAQTVQINSIKISEDKNRIDSVIVVENDDDEVVKREDNGDGVVDIETTTPQLQLENDIVETTYGPVKGYLENQIITYYDVPYGKITEPLQAPIEPDVWTETREITAHNSICPQLRNNEVVGNLNCLTLSIFTPSQVENGGVLFYIHGGDFNTGSGDSLVYGPEYFVSKGIIVILPNYRLGPLGFLCLQNEYVPGNAALKDLTLALQWTSNNIAAFGGNPSNIVVSGDGISGVLAEYLVLYPLSSVYINKAITESGSVLSQLAIDREPLTTALELAKYLSNDSSTTDVNIIRESDYKDLILHSQNLKFKPCIEKTSNAFINITVLDLLRDEIINKTFMIGSANHAGFHEYAQLTEEIVEEINRDYKHLVPYDLRFNQDWQKTDAANNIKKQYFGDDVISLVKTEELTLFYTDILYLGPAIRTARPLLDAGSQVYFYEFSYSGDLNRETDLPTDGAARGDTAGYLFKQPNVVVVEGSEDERKVKFMTDLWVSFIQNGEPTAENVVWHPLMKSVEDQEDWLSIGANVTVHHGVHVERLALWTALYEEFHIDRNPAAKHTHHLYLFTFVVLMHLGIPICYQ